MIERIVLESVMQCFGTWDIIMLTMVLNCELLIFSVGVDTGCEQVIFYGQRKNYLLWEK